MKPYKKLLVESQKLYLDLQKKFNDKLLNSVRENSIEIMNDIADRYSMDAVIDGEMKELAEVASVMSDVMKRLDELKEYDKEHIDE